VAADEPDETALPAAPPVSARPSRRLLKLGILVVGLLVAAYFGSKAPRDQHVKLVLGASADRVTGLEIQYLAPDGDLARAVRMTFEAGRAPRVVSHEPQLADGDYTVRVDLDTREGRRSTERRVTLGGGTTQVDLAGVISAPAGPDRPAPRTAP
jgi:hypothetical protein